MADENEVMPVREKTVPQPPPLPQGSILTDAEAPKPATAAPAHVATGPSPATAAAIIAVQAAATLIGALTPVNRNTQTALRMCNDAMGLLQKA